MSQRWVNSLLLLAAFTCVFCEKPELCEDSKLSLTKQPFTPAALKTNGYYYGNPSTDTNNITRYSILVLYTDGTLYSTGGDELAKLDDYVQMLQRGSKTGFLQSAKFGWGVFQVENNEIKAECWAPADCGYPTLLSSGAILNDTTFTLTQLHTSYPNKVEQINQSFAFRNFIAKPDSTNPYTQ